MTTTILKTIAFASDHAGYDLRHDLMAYAQSLGWQVVDLGAPNRASVDYPDYAHYGAQAVLQKDVTYAVLICGTGIGMSIAANRFPGIRAALCHHAYEAKVAKEHNGANILCFGGRTMGFAIARECLQAFLSATFLEGRHQERLNKIHAFS